MWLKNEKSLFDVLVDSNFRPFKLEVVNCLTLWKIIMFTNSPTNSPSSSSTVCWRSPWLSPYAPSSESPRKSPQHSNNYPSSGCIPMSPIIHGLHFQPCKAIRIRKRYSTREMLCILCKVDGVLSTNPDLSLCCVSKELKVPVSLISKWRKQQDSFLLLSIWKNGNPFRTSVSSGSNWTPIAPKHF